MKSAKCPQCGFVGWADAEVCKKCGAPVAQSGVASPAPEVAVNNFNEHQYVNQHQQVDENQTYYYPANVNPFPEDLKNGWAITALVSGILNFMLLGIFVLPTIAGIVISAVAMKKIKRQPLEYGGNGMAVGGLILNIVSAVALIPIMLIAAIAIPNLLAARRAANEGSAINALRTIHSAEMTYQATEGRGYDFGTLVDLERKNLINTQLASGTRSGYKFMLDSTLKDSEGQPAFVVVAVPTDYPSSGKRSFFVDETGVIRGEDNHGLEASRNAPPLRSGGDYSDSRSRGRSNTSDDY
jgi:type II secretory pathway pseudopilin PulG